MVTYFVLIHVITCNSLKYDELTFDIIYIVIIIVVICNLITLLSNTKIITMNIVIIKICYIYFKPLIILSYDDLFYYDTIIKINYIVIGFRRTKPNHSAFGALSVTGNPRH